MAVEKLQTAAARTTAVRLLWLKIDRASCALPRRVIFAQHLGVFIRPPGHRRASRSRYAFTHVGAKDNAANRGMNPVDYSTRNAGRRVYAEPKCEVVVRQPRFRRCRHVGKRRRTAVQRDRE